MPYHSPESSFSVERYPEDELILKATDPEVIDFQVETLLAHYGSALKITNNLIEKIPGGGLRAYAEIGKTLDMPFAMIDGIDNRPEARSNRAFNVTQGQFFMDVDRAIEELGDEYALALSRLNGEFRASLAGYGRAEKKEALAEFVLPVYKKLRMAGYSHYDLRQ